MPKKRFGNKQIAIALRQAEAGMAVSEICYKLGIAEATFYRWKKVYAGMGVSEIRRLKQLQDKERQCLNASWFLFLDDARTWINSWRTDYNETRPHLSLGSLTPSDFATRLKETRNVALKPDQKRDELQFWSAFARSRLQSRIGSSFIWSTRCRH